MIKTVHQSERNSPTRALMYVEDKLADADEYITRNVAVILGINEYESDDIPSLKTARPDAERLSEILEDKHDYEVSFDDGTVSTLLVDGQATKKGLEDILAILSRLVTETDRLLFYFAGHGVALRGEDGPQGYLVPQDATADRESYVLMQELHDTLTMLPCRHCLIILDCCFSGSFRWSSTRAWSPPPRTLYVEEYLRFVRYPAWQVLTSTAYDQEAVDSLTGSGFGVREESGQTHSPFAQALFNALQGGDNEADANDDGILMATELQLYLRNKVEVKVEQKTGRQQTPQLWGLHKHDKGEYIFLLGEPSLKPAPEPSVELNPYRGLEPYNEEHADKFFGRGRLIELLAQTVTAQPLTILLGASGTGKSSLVKAGLLPYLQQFNRESETVNWVMWRMPGEAGQPPQPLRPTEAPLYALTRLLTRSADLDPKPADVNLSQDINSVSRVVSTWGQRNPDQRLLLVIDQFEELITLCRDEVEQKQFVTLLLEAVEANPNQLRLIITLRSDFEPQIRDLFSQVETITINTTAESNGEADKLGQVETRSKNAVPSTVSTADQAEEITPASTLVARFVVPPLTQDELRDVIEQPARRAAIHFEPADLVDKLVNEVIQTPGALPLLSFTLSELYLSYFRRYQDGEADERTLIEADYEAIGGVAGSLSQRASAEYDQLGDGSPDVSPAQATMRRVMLRMIAFEGGELARRPVHHEELIYPDEAENERVKIVLANSIEARLLVTGNTYIEPAHDALVRAWDQLRIWSQEAEEYLPLQRRLTQSANDWVQAPENEKNASLWHNNPRLPQLQHLLEESVHHNGHSLGFFGRSWQSAFPSTEIFEGQTWLNRRETEFVKQSILQKGKNLRRLIATVVVIILVLSGLTIFAFTQQGIANEQRTIADEERNAAVTSEANAEERRIIAVTAEAEAQEQRDIAVSAEATAVAERDIALSRQLAIQADSELSNNDYSLALLLAIESGAASDTVEAFQVLREVLAQPARISQVFPGHFANVNSIEWSPDGRHILTASSDATARKWDVESGAEDLNIRSVYGPLQRAVWSPDGSPSFLTIGTSVENTLQMWDAETGDELFELLRAGINDLQWSADGKRLLTAHIDGTAHIYDAEQGELLAELTGHQGEIKSVSWNGDETRILTVSNDGSAGLWDGMSGGLIETFGGKTEDVLSQALWSPDGQRILTADNIGNIQIWDADDGQPLLSLPNEEESRRIAAWNPAGTEIVTGSRNGTAAVWDAASGVQLRALQGHTNRIRHVAWNEDGSQIITSGADAIRVWDRSQEEQLFELETNGLALAEWGPEEQTIYTIRSNSDDSIQIWDAGSGASRLTLDGNVIQVEAAPTGSRFAIARSVDHVLRLWDLSDYSEVQSISSISETLQLADVDPFTEAYLGAYPITPTRMIVEVSAVGISPDGLRAIVADNRINDSDGGGALWDSERGERLFTFERTPTSGRWSVDGTKILTAHDDGTLTIWDGENGAELVNLQGHTGSVGDAYWNGDETLVVSVGDDFTARVWDLGREQLLFPLSGHTGAVTSAAWNEDETLILTIGEDQTVRIWDAATGAEKAILSGLYAEWAAGGEQVRVVVDNEGTVTGRFTRMSDLLRVACDRAPRGLTEREWQTYMKGRMYQDTCQLLAPGRTGKGSS